jgi:hypothetical protein
MILRNLFLYMSVCMLLCTYVFLLCVALPSRACIPCIDSFDVLVLAFISFLVVYVLLSVIKFVYCQKHGIECVVHM